MPSNNSIILALITLIWTAGSVRAGGVVAERARSEKPSISNLEKQLDRYEPEAREAFANGASAQHSHLHSNYQSAVVGSMDPDESPEMEKAWVEWRRQIDSMVYLRYSTLSNAAFARTLKPLGASAQYVVTKDRRVVDVKLVQGSANAVFNTLVTGVIKSMSDQAVLQFPHGSKRLTVEMSGTFTQNCGIGDFGFPGEIDWDPRRLQMHQAR